MEGAVDKPVDNKKWSNGDLWFFFVMMMTGFFSGWFLLDPIEAKAGTCFGENGCDAWYAASSLNLAGDATVTEWPDELGGFDLGNAGAPIFKLNEKNTHPAVYFDGTDDELFNSSFATSQPIMMFVVEKWYSSTPSFGYSAHFGGGGIYALGDPQLNIYAGSTLAWNPSSGMNQWHIVAAVFDGASSEIWVNGTQEASGAAGSNTATDICIGSSCATNFGNVTVAEVLYFSVNDSAVRENIEDCLADKYAISVSSAGVCADPYGAEQQQEATTTTATSTLIHSGDLTFGMSLMVYFAAVIFFGLVFNITKVA